MTPYYEHAGITIYHGDCREFLPNLPPIDLVLTDPPYGISHTSSHGATWAGTQIANDHDTSVRDFVWDFYADIDRAFFGISWKCPPPKGVRGVIVWNKGPAFGAGDLRFPWKPCWEEIYIAGTNWAGRRDEGVVSITNEPSWESGPAHDGNGRVHPHQKPVALINHLLGKNPARLILDPFMGSGTTLRAAKDLGRKAIGIEIEEKYCEIAAKRLSQEVLPL